jgi:menaquinone-dependent protoporphyrinogen IX oxidase
VRNMLIGIRSLRESAVQIKQLTQSKKWKDASKILIGMLVRQSHNVTLSRAYVNKIFSL